MRTVGIAIAVFLSVLAVVGVFYAVSGWFSLYDYGWGVMGVAGTAGAVAMLLLLNIHTPTLWLGRRHWSAPPKGTWADSVPAAIAGCVLAAGAGYLMTRAAVAMALRPDRGEGVPSVLSMRRELQPLWDKAHVWRDDAYLDDATIYIGEDNRWHCLLRAHFQSPSEHWRSVSFCVDTDGTILQTLVDWTVEVRQHRPIVDSEWPLDSADALEAFARNDEIGFCLRSTGPHSHRLTLERLAGSDDARAVWTLLLDACSGAPNNRYYIDAATGEFLAPDSP